MAGGQDHWTRWCGASKASCAIDGGLKSTGAWDLWSQSNENFPGTPEIGMNGTINETRTYSGEHPPIGSVSRRCAVLCRVMSYAAILVCHPGFIYPNKIIEIIAQHAAAAESPAAMAPLFVYWAIHNTHAPIEAPARFIEQYAHFNDPKKETFTAMVSVVDEGVSRCTTDRRPLCTQTGPSHTRLGCTCLYASC